MAISSRAATLKESMANALNKELEIARKVSQGDRANEAKNGTQTRQKGDSFVYEFEELTGFPPEEGVQVTFTVGEKTSKGRYLGEVNSKFIFEFEEDMGSTLEIVTVVSDPLFLLEKQISVLSKDAPFENQVALSSLGLSDYLKRKNRAAPYPFHSIYPPRAYPIHYPPHGGHDYPPLKHLHPHLVLIFPHFHMH